jgi:hypothetical protein
MNFNEIPAEVGEQLGAGAGGAGRAGNAGGTARSAGRAGWARLAGAEADDRSPKDATGRGEREYDTCE